MRLRRENQNFNTANPAGFTLVEALIVLGLLAALLAVGWPLYGQWQTRLSLDAAAVDLKQLVNLARARARAGFHNANHGVYFDPAARGGQATLYQGESYGGRDPAFDQVLELGAQVTVSLDLAGPDLNFSRYDGQPSQSGAITLLDRDSQASWQITINEAGTVY